MRFEKPIVREAIVDIRFEAPTTRSLFSTFAEKVRHEYEAFEVIQLPSFTVEVGPNGPRAQPRQTSQSLARYTTDAPSPFALSLALDGLSLHVLPVYPGWSVVRERLDAAWSDLTDALPAAAPVHIGLRYINVIVCEMEEDTPGRYLQASDYLPPAVLRSYPLPPFTVEERQGDQGTMLRRMSLARAWNDRAERFGVFLWEIERSEAYDANAFTSVLDAADALHEELSGAQGMFTTALGPALTERMQPSTASSTATTAN